MVGRALLAMVLLHCGLAGKRVNVQYQWNTPEFVFPSESVKQSMMEAGNYVYGNPIILDVDVWEGGYEQKVIVTLPRLKPGVPATIATLSSRYALPGETSSPQLVPFPDWGWHRQGACDGITSVFRVHVDPCGRMWVIDSGVVDILTDFKRICQPQILIFDLRTNKMVKRYRIPKADLEDDSLLITIAADVRDLDGKCRNAFAYVADVTEYGLIVYDVNKGKSWRVSSNLFYPYPSAGYFTIAGESFDLMDGLFGLALSPVVNGDRTLYFHSLASFREAWVSTSVLRNESLFEHGINTAARMFQESLDERPSQTAATAMNENRVLFFNLLSRNSLNCWDSRKEYTGRNLIELDRDDEALQFVSGMKVVRDKQGHEVLWAISCRFQKIMTGTFSTDEVNFRVLMAPVADLVRGTACAAKSASTGYQGGSNGSGYQGANSGSGYPGANSGSGYQGPSSGGSHQGASSGTGYQGASGGSGYQGASGGSSYPVASSGSGYQGASSGGGYLGPSNGSGYQGPSSGSGYQSISFPH